MSAPGVLVADVKIIRRKGLQQFSNLMDLKRNDKVGIKGEAGPSICDCRQATDEAVRNPRSLESIRDQANLQHIRL